jgi:hypothetical protein
MRRIVVLAVGLLVLGAVPAQATAGEPDVVRNGPCSGESGWRLELEDSGDRIKVRFVVRGSQDHRWRIVLRHGQAGPEAFDYGDGRVFFSGTKASGGFFSTQVEVRRSVADLEGDDGFAAKAVDQQTGQLCHMHIRMSVGVSLEAPATEDGFQGLYRATLRPVPGTQCGDTISRRRVEVVRALGGSQSVRRIDFVHSTHGSDRLRYVAGKRLPWRTADAFIALRYRPSTNSAVGIWHGICDSHVHLVSIR